MRFTISVLSGLSLSALALGAALATTPTPTPTSVPTAAATPAPQEVATFTGTAWLDAHTSLGPVAATIGGLACSEPSVSGFGPDGSGPLYTLRVVSSEVKPGCGTEGAVINFTVEGQLAAQTATWHAATTQHLNLIAGPAFARFAGTLQINSRLSNEALVPYIAGNPCGDGEFGPPPYAYGAVVFSDQQQAGCGTEGAQVTFKLVASQGNVTNVTAVAGETGTWHAWDGVSAPQQLNLTFIPVGGGVTTPSVGTGDAPRAGSDLWTPIGAALAVVGLVAITGAFRLRRQKAKS